MSTWTKLENRKISKMKNGCVFETKPNGFEWFPISAIPELYAISKDMTQWIPTGVYSYTREKPAL